MDSLDRLKRIEILLNQMKEESPDDFDKKLDRIDYHLNHLNQAYKQRLILDEISVEEFELLRRILYDYRCLQGELSKSKEQLMAKRNIHRRRTHVIQKGYFNKSVIKKSRFINKYK